ncbi:MAG TPA: type II secretion system protein [Candidatus Saccharimonadales bacterium]|jgi:prepilin-type N-terminal cleavage/methylation domain-containing protein|nr:type II secretion system protein [Candidatus Saccharimonadales bacterium]
MLSPLKPKRQDGFTIIEVLIVLAIAGLIMLIVFLAVPALQRNARNTQRRNDVSSLLSGVSEFVNDNNGQLPTSVSVGGDGQTTFTGGSGTTSIQGAKVGFYQDTHVHFGNASSSPSASTDDVYILTGATCNGNSVTNGSSRSFVAEYWVEGSGNGIQQCQGS